MKLIKLIIDRQNWINKEVENGGQLFMGLPDRWMERPGPKWRCVNGHVRYLHVKSEKFGPLCMKCFESVLLTFPEDKDDDI